MISVIIPTYNRAHLIDKTLDSILIQSYKDWECIIVDDYSSDDTKEVVHTYLDKDKRFQFYLKPKHLSKGPSSSRNYGLTKANGEFINWFDSDDLMHPQKMEIDLKMINSGDYDFTISQSQFFRDDQLKPLKKYWNTNLWSNDPINDFILMKIGWSVNSSLWKKETLVNKNIHFNEKIFTADDYEYHIKAILNNLKPVIINEVVANLREHDNRLNDYKLKDPSKIEVNNFIISLISSGILTDESVNFINQKTYKQLCNLLKKKKLSLYLLYLLKVFKSKHRLKTKLKLAFKLPFGLFFIITNKGYRLLN